ncbi:nucleotidyltransferase substrate binding protein, HI0074 family [Thermoanaerobacter mathranii subsp. mathranii str. A3]|uniref:Nucleotidyltransferase substrate binding protein, HI0074 family n=1 Tax=Thermoanaerobacter mathranii subsp. mathranii (strain DSM 11426 / CCUG 53645 / CIP 108742 / A3) TaxID=583358 RepID=A0ABN3Z1N5_THEM3|nr:HI0074 family nucleotidyltransferase substrate-binding subunit [Thermoanaerobacter mathranii]ADH60487.1 nucleotidyltransferase substrate binding protein, HI0074 family [Thermoanaerobacter mathranii subsp. mathranii str. A3]
MRERVEKFFNDFAKAFENLKKATEVAKDDLDIDGTIKRFELCYELAWKLMKEYLADLGIIVKGPREAFKQAFINDLIENEEVWLKMIEDRNLLVHIYTHEQSRDIFQRIKDEHVAELGEFYKSIQQKIENDEF